MTVCSMLTTRTRLKVGGVSVVAGSAEGAQGTRGQLSIVDCQQPVRTTSVTANDAPTVRRTISVQSTKRRSAATNIGGQTPKVDVTGSAPDASRSG